MTRTALPGRREAETIGLKYFDGRNEVWHTFGFSRFEDGRIAEVFSYVHYGTGNDAESYARDAAIILSLALQHGAPLETIAHAITRDHQGRPATLIGAIIERLRNL